MFAKFSSRNAMRYYVSAGVRLSVRPFVCLSVTPDRPYCIQTAKISSQFYSTKIPDLCRILDVEHLTKSYRLMLTIFSGWIAFGTRKTSIACGSDRERTRRNPRNYQRISSMLYRSCMVCPCQTCTLLIECRSTLSDCIRHERGGYAMLTFRVRLSVCLSLCLSVCESMISKNKKLS